MAALKPENIKFIVVHCTATKRSQDFGYAEVDAAHKARTYRTRSGEIRNWSGCGYHVIIRKGGAIEMGRSLQTKGAHVGSVGHNHDSWGVSMEGGLDEAGKPEDNFDADQYRSLEMIVRGLLYRAPTAEVVGHRDLSPDKDGDGIIDENDWLKMCPCFFVVDWWKKVLSGGSYYADQ